MIFRYWLAQAILFALILSPVYSQAPAGWTDPSPHKTQLVRVDADVQVEVLDWGGTGRPIVLLAGGGNTAHIFDDFAPRLTPHFHVYGITRRGFGVSGYSATDDPNERLGDDVLAVLDSLHLNKPILAGHSIAGAELSFIANNHPGRIGGLVYLDAAYSYAFDNGKGANINEMQALRAPQPPPPSEADMASFKSLQKYYERMNGFRFPEAELREQRESGPDGRVGKERKFPGNAMFMRLMSPTKKFTDIPVPALIIFANPHSQGSWIDQNTNPSVRAAANTYSLSLASLTAKQERAVEDAIPSAHVITLADASHYVFLSNEAEVLRDIQSFASILH